MYLSLENWFIVHEFSLCSYGRFLCSWSATFFFLILSHNCSNEFSPYSYDFFFLVRVIITLVHICLVLWIDFQLLKRAFTHFIWILSCLYAHFTCSWLQLWWLQYVCFCKLIEKRKENLSSKGFCHFDSYCSIWIKSWQVNRKIRTIYNGFHFPLFLQFCGSLVDIIKPYIKHSICEPFFSQKQQIQQCISTRSKYYKPRFQTTSTRPQREDIRFGERG